MIRIIEVRYMARALFILAVFILGAVAFFSTPAPANAQVVINEFSSFNNPNNPGDPGDWVEVYNYGTEPLDLSNYRIRDSSKTQKIDLAGILNPGEFKSFDLKDYLNKSGDVIRLIKMEGGNEIETVMTVCYGSMKDDCDGIKVGCYPENGEQSVGSYPSDGGNTFERFAKDTRDSTNTTATLSPCPTPTPEPTNTPTPPPTPTKTPTPTKYPTSTPKTTNTPTQATTNTPPPIEDNESNLFSNNLSPSPESDGEFVLGYVGETDGKEASKSEVYSTKIKKSPLGAFLIMGMGFFLLFAGIYLIVKKKLKGVKSDDEQEQQ